MSTAWADLAFLALLVLSLVAVHVPLGDYVFGVYTSEHDWRVEKLFYRLVGVDPRNQQSWYVYPRSVLSSSWTGQPEKNV